MNEIGSGKTTLLAQFASRILEEKLSLKAVPRHFLYLLISQN
jgi:Ni2+-binding GTPase involved in maturation of urease and hydrogenase